MTDSHTVDIENYRQRINQAASQIRQTFPYKPDVLLVLGSGLGRMAEQISRPIILPYSGIGGFPLTTVPGHDGRLIMGQWENKTIAVMQGRFHYYEGHSMADIVLPVRVMQKLGVKYLILTNAAGGIDTSMHPGDLMLIRDHISFWAESPLRGLNLPEFGPLFPDMTQVYDRKLANLAAECANDLKIPIHNGIYAYCKGPQFETPAEIRMLRLLGATAAGMSTVPEAIAGSHGGMRTLGISCITNLAAGILDKPLSHQEVLEVGNHAAASTIALLSAIIRRLPDSIKE